MQPHCFVLTWPVDQVEVVLGVFLDGVRVGVEVAGLLASHELAVVGPEGNGPVGMPDQLEQTVG